MKVHSFGQQFFVKRSIKMNLIRSIGNIFDNKFVEYVVIPVNVVGLLQTSLGMDFKKTLNEFYIEYQQFLRNEIFTTGQIAFSGDANLGLVFFAIRKSWHNKAKYMFVEHCLNFLSGEIIYREIRSVAFPALGCGSGGLDFDKVSQMIIKALQGFPNLDVYLYLPK
jgi:hypothetical protein